LALKFISSLVSSFPNFNGLVVFKGKCIVCLQMFRCFVAGER
jgi:hypothetical protein